MHAGEQLGLDDGSLAGRVGLVRALVLIGVALVIGGLLVFRGLDSGPDTVAAGPDTSAGAGDDEGSVDDVGATPGSTPGEAVDGGESPAALSTASTAPGTTVAAVSEGSTSTTAPAASSSTTVAASSTTAAATDAASTTVLVLNAASGKGVAAAGAQILKDAGYTVMAPKNANGPSKSKILYTKGNEAAAEAVAAVFDVDPAGVVGAFDPAKSPIASIGDAGVIVVIGTDGVIKTS